MRPRGWHLDEKHLTLDGEPLVGGLVDFGLYFFHNAAALLERGSGPYFYLPKMESHLEARLWNDAFSFAQLRLGMNAAIPPIANAPRRWQVFTNSWVYARRNGAAIVTDARSGSTKSSPESRKYLIRLNR